MTISGLTTKLQTSRSHHKENDQILLSTTIVL